MSYDTDKGKRPSVSTVPPFSFTSSHSLSNITLHVAFATPSAIFPTSRSLTLYVFLVIFGMSRAVKIELTWEKPIPLSSAAKATLELASNALGPLEPARCCLLVEMWFVWEQILH